MNNTERFIARFYRFINKVYPEQLTIEGISSQLNLRVFYWPHSSAMTERQGDYGVFINETLNDRRQWQDFGHEMCHYFGDDVKNVLHENYINYRESKANYFSYHFCVPTFMLQEFEEVSVHVIMRRFNVDYEFALRRFEMHQNRILLGKENEKWQKDMQGIEAVTSGN